MTEKDPELTQSSFVEKNNPVGLWASMSSGGSQQPKPVLSQQPKPVPVSHIDEKHIDPLPPPQQLTIIQEEDDQDTKELDWKDYMVLLQKNGDFEKVMVRYYLKALEQIISDSRSSYYNSVKDHEKDIENAVQESEEEMETLNQKKYIRELGNITVNDYPNIDDAKFEKSLKKYTEKQLGFDLVKNTVYDKQKQKQQENIPSITYLKLLEYEAMYKGNGDMRAPLPRNVLVSYFLDLALKTTNDKLKGKKADIENQIKENNEGIQNEIIRLKKQYGNFVVRGGPNGSYIDQDSTLKNAYKQYIKDVFEIDLE